MTHTAHIQAWCSCIDMYTVQYYSVFVFICVRMCVYMCINVEPACRVCSEEWT